jgi:hypothetical protein
MRYALALCLALAACGDPSPVADCGNAPAGTHWDTSNGVQCILLCNLQSDILRYEVCGGGYTGVYGVGTGTGNGDGTPRCVNISADRANCGACGNVCTCPSGRVVSCTASSNPSLPRPAYCHCD